MGQQQDDAEQRIRIFKEGQGSVARAVPGHAVVARGESVVWKNLTEHDLRIVFPDGDEIFENGMDRVLRIPAGDASSPVRVRQDARQGPHPYMGVCQDRGRAGLMVEGGSHPMIIID